MKGKSPSFTSRVLTVVQSIPKGETLSYAAVAARAGSPRAARAVGTIMRNNYNLTVPCHRVVHTNGSVGNYNRGGTAAKKKLLQQEGAI